MISLHPIWDDPGIQEVTAGEIECCARCIHLAADFADDFPDFKKLRFVHFVWRDFHRDWQPGDPESWS